MRLTFDDEYWIRRCFHLAERGKGYTSPNPLVGAVIVKAGVKLGEGYHHRYGGHHAEINAINAALKKVTTLRGATMYVNLEPCSHYGQTPPCVDAIIKHQFSRVVISTIDPNPVVKGKGIKKLRRHGIECSTGILEHDAARLNEKFFTFIQTGLPFTALKVAQTRDGFIAKRNGTSQWITDESSRQYVHQLRSEYDAVLIGANTVKKDNAQLTVRDVNGRNPLRVVLDGRFSTSVNSRVYNGEAPTMVYITRRAYNKNAQKIQQLQKKNVTVIALPSEKNVIKPIHILRDLAKRNITSLCIEGGQTVFTSFINSGYVKKIYLFTAPKTFGKGLAAFGTIKVPIAAMCNRTERFNSDIFEEYYIRYLKW
jgi:diaminohydroxyphosphoribosylaminopyrimidine deaminase/5-amino-6-(5-phosphoribosylamino)uracil reductase